MKPVVATARRLLLAVALVVPAIAQAGVITSAYAGQGNLVVFDAAGNGGWVGEIDAVPPPIDGVLPTLVSVVTFGYDPVAQVLSGDFEFTVAADLSSSLLGSLSAAGVDPSFFSDGGQLGLDLSITGGSGDYSGASGFGLSFLNWDPTASGLNNYTETGLLSFAVPEPAALALVATGLLAAAVGRRRRQPLN